MKRDDGTYMCVAENPAGLRRAVAAVRVKGQIGQLLTLIRSKVNLGQIIIMFRYNILVCWECCDGFARVSTCLQLGYCM